MAGSMDQKYYRETNTLFTSSGSSPSFTEFKGPLLCSQESVAGPLLLSLVNLLYSLLLTAFQDPFNVTQGRTVAQADIC